MGSVKEGGRLMLHKVEDQGLRLCQRDSAGVFPMGTRQGSPGPADFGSPHLFRWSWALAPVPQCRLGNGRVGRGVVADRDHVCLLHCRDQFANLHVESLLLAPEEANVGGWRVALRLRLGRRVGHGIAGPSLLRNPIRRGRCLAAMGPHPLNEKLLPKASKMRHHHQKDVCHG